MLLNTTQIHIDQTIDGSSAAAVSNAAVASALAGKSDVSTIEPVTSASPVLTLANNTVYQCSNDLTSLTFNAVAAGFSYASLTFTSGSTATSFAVPASGWYCVGADCSGGTFTPAASMRYNLAIEQESDRVAVYVMEAL